MTKTIIRFILSILCFIKTYQASFTEEHEIHHHGFMLPKSDSDLNMHNIQSDGIIEAVIKNESSVKSICLTNFEKLIKKLDFVGQSTSRSISTEQGKELTYKGLINDVLLLCNNSIKEFSTLFVRSEAEHLLDKGLNFFVGTSIFYK
eukprot:GAHX01003856.1.p1 GENE.GAHX01003856.1~~GAHX01003856.1.p1  ORF type:complete len:147 (-),score=13.41 GAHX01003856.1:104-544(-)